MGKRNTPAVKAEEKVTEHVVLSTETVASVFLNSATVVWRLGTRTFTKAIHGDDFADLAKQFVAKHGGEIV